MARSFTAPTQVHSGRPSAERNWKLMRAARNGGRPRRLSVDAIGGASMHRRTFLYGAGVVVAAVAAPRPSLAGPVTRDAIGDQVQRVPKDQLPDFAGPNLPDVHKLYAY